MQATVVQDSGFDCSVVEVFRENKIDGIEFVSLSRDDMKELGISALGDRKKLLRLIHTLESEVEAESPEIMISTPATSNGSFLSFSSNKHSQDDSLSSCHSDYSNSSISEEAGLYKEHSIRNFRPPGSYIASNVIANIYMFIHFIADNNIERRSDTVDQQQTSMHEDEPTSELPGSVRPEQVKQRYRIVFFTVYFCRMILCCHVPQIP